MRSVAADRLIVVALIGLVIVSVWLKSVAQPPVPPARPGGLEQAIAATLAAQGFAVRQHRLPLGSILIDGRRGGCRLRARDATGAVGTEAAFAQNARGIGPLTFLFADRAYSAPPVLQTRLERLRQSALHVFGSDEALRVPIALAASPECGRGSFGLGDMRRPA